MIVDTGILYALVDRDDRHHRAAQALFRDAADIRIVPEAVVVEADWMILEYLGVEVEIAFLRGLTEGALAIEPATRADLQRAADLVEQYRDARIGYVDAVVVAIAERLGERRIATVDRRHFGAIRPRHADSFELVP